MCSYCCVRLLRRGALCAGKHRGKDSEGAVVPQFEVVPQQVTTATAGIAKTLIQDGR
jgi:hypothetical protein